jgi:anti-sigma B factor antagonist
MLEVKIENKSGILVIEPIGRLDGLSSKQFLEEIDKQILKDSNQAILNLEKLDYISSEGLRSILTTAKKTKSLGGKLVLCAPRDGVKEVLDISGFGQMLGVYETEAQAIESM